SAPARPDHVLANTLLVISIAISQRMPSHWAAMPANVSAAVARNAGENALSCTTSGHGGKYGSRPRASMLLPARIQLAGSDRMSSSPPRTNNSGLSLTHG